MEPCAPLVALYVVHGALVLSLIVNGVLAGVAWNRGKVVESIERRAILESLARGKLAARSAKAPPRARVGFRPPAQ